MYPKVQSERLILRKMKLSDAKRVQYLAGDIQIYKTTLTIPHPYEDGVAESWIKRHQENYQKRRALVFAIEIKNSKIVIGAISLMFERFNKCEVGYWIGKEYWNQGYCSEACTALIDFAFTNLELNKIVGKHLAINGASGKVMKKCGMKKEGELLDDVIKDSRYHDVFIWGIRYEDWLNNKKTSNKI